MTYQHILKVSRIEGLTDGIFAIGMTILILNLHVPLEFDDPHLSQFLKHDILFNIFIYIGSFTILGTHWIAMNFQSGMLCQLNRTYLWMNMFYLMTICVVPFSANLLGIYPRNVYSIYFYAGNLLCCSLGQVLTFKSAAYFKLYNEIYPDAVYRAGMRRAMVAPPFYVSSMLLAHWHIKAAFFLLILPTIIYLKPGKIDKYETKYD